jgi:hypothetical protein
VALICTLYIPSPGRPLVLAGDGPIRGSEIPTRSPPFAIHLTLKSALICTLFGSRLVVPLVPARMIAPLMIASRPFPYVCLYVTAVSSGDGRMALPPLRCACSSVRTTATSTPPAARRRGLARCHRPWRRAGRTSGSPRWGPRIPARYLARRGARRLFIKRQIRCVELICVSVDRAHGLPVVATAPTAIRSPAAAPAPAGPTTPPTAPRNWLCSRAKLRKIHHLTASSISVSIAPQIGFVRAISAPPGRRPAGGTRTTGGTAGHGELRTGPESPSREIP